MASGKPVLTTTDAGGPLEFVRHARPATWLNPSPSAAERLDYLDEHRQEATAMAAECQRTAQPITWENAVRVLLGRRRPRRALPGETETENHGDDYVPDLPAREGAKPDLSPIPEPGFRI